MKTTDHTIARRKAHHAALVTLHAFPASADGLKMFRALSRLENEAHAAATAQCNGEPYHGQPFRPDYLPDGSEGTDETPTPWDEYTETVYNRAARIFGGKIPAGFRFNQDPRGYALKIDPDKGTVPDGMHTDWGGYGILAAEIN